MNGSRFLYVCILLFILQKPVFGTFDPVVVKAKIDAFKAQMTAVTNARTAALKVKDTMDSALLPYQKYSATSKVVTDATALSASFAAKDAPYQSLAKYSDTTFDPAYQAYFTFNAGKIAATITSALSALKAQADVVNSLIAARATAQNFFAEVVAGVEKPAFLGP